MSAPWPVRHRSVGLLTFALFAIVAAAQLGGSCVEGVTPDCSSPASGCNPMLEAGADDAAALPDAAPEAGDTVDASDASDSGASDAARDAPDGG